MFSMKTYGVILCLVTSCVLAGCGGAGPTDATAAGVVSGNGPSYSGVTMGGGARGDSTSTGQSVPSEGGDGGPAMGGGA
jgi:hypothetical protein